MEIGFSSYSGLDFLLFYTALLVAAFAASLFIPAMMRDDGRAGSAGGHEGLAYLSGGPRRFSESVLAKLFAEDKLLIEGKRIAVNGAQSGRTPAEQALLAEHGELSWKRAGQVLSDQSARIDDALVTQGLLMARGDRIVVRTGLILPFVFLLLIGLFRFFAGQALGEPVGFLGGLMVLTAVLAIMRWIRFSPLTRAGIEALDAARAGAARLRSAPRQGEVGMAVGLFGTGVLMGTPYAPLHELRSAQAAGGGGDSGCGDGGGGGCGGGGCGGCGG